MKFLKKKYIRLFAVLMIAFVTMSFVKSYLIKTKNLTEQFMVNPESHLRVKNNCGPIQFKNTDDVEARIEATITVEGKTDEEIAKVLEHFKLHVEVSGKTIDVSADTHVKDWIQYNTFFYKKNTITFDDGSTAVDIKDTEVSLVVYLPKVKELTIDNKYDDIIFESFNSDVNVELFSGDFKGGDIMGDLDITLKYGSLNIGNIENGKIVLFDSDANFGTGMDLDISSKYSELKFEDITSLRQTSFDDELVYENVEKDFKLDAKYTDVVLKNFSTAVMDVFDSNIVAGGGKTLEIDSKYSTIKFDDLDEVEIDFFDDDINLGNVSKLNVVNSKYSSFEIDKIDNEFIVKSSFDDDFVVNSVGVNIADVSFYSKYSDLNFPIPSQVAYQLDANLNYCDFIYPDTGDIETKLESGNRTEIIYKLNNPSEDGVKVNINATSGTIIIK